LPQPNGWGFYFLAMGSIMAAIALDPGRFLMGAKTLITTALTQADLHDLSMGRMLDVNEKFALIMNHFTQTIVYSLQDKTYQQLEFPVRINGYDVDKAGRVVAAESAILLQRSMSDYLMTCKVMLVDCRTMEYVCEITLHNLVDKFTRKLFVTLPVPASKSMRFYHYDGDEIYILISDRYRSRNKHINCNLVRIDLKTGELIPFAIPLDPERCRIVGPGEFIVTYLNTVYYLSIYEKRACWFNQEIFHIGNDMIIVLLRSKCTGKTLRFAVYRKCDIPVSFEFFKYAKDGIVDIVCSYPPAQKLPHQILEVRDAARWSKLLYLGSRRYGYSDIVVLPRG